ncbi:MAG: phosphate-starvation-inducible PsiE family protein [Streptosporangiaceae bacterium]
MPDASDTGHPAAQPATGGPPAPAPEPRPVVAGSIWVLEHAQDIVTVTIGVVLIVLAATLAVSGVVDFINQVRTQPIAAPAINLLDRVLLVLILVEIVHTVVLSLRAHRLAAQPFIVVGLVAVIRRILFLLSNEHTIPTTELALLLAMVVAFVAAYLAVSYFEKPGAEDLPAANQEDPGPAGNISPTGRVNP